MRYRASIVPRGWLDLGALLFLLFAISFTFLFEVGVALPSLVGGGPLYWLQLLVGLFMVHNILGNLYALMRVDTSTHGLLLPASLKPEWRFCAACEATAPPRSWHCLTCRGCILKRDHHCLFAGCCVGHFNQRYFLLFLAHLAAGAFYASILNTIFIVRVVGGFHLLSLLQLVMPTAMLVFGIDLSVKQVYAFLFTLDWVGFLFVLMLLIIHSEGAFKGATGYEKARKQFKYDLGRRENVRQVFGARWHLTWLSPLVHSPLPSDGTQFVTGEQFRVDGAKHR